MSTAGHNSELSREINQALADFFGGRTFKVIALAGDASNRRYFRIVSHGPPNGETAKQSTQDSQSWDLMVWEPFDRKNYPFLSVQELFAQHKIQVPEVKEVWPHLGLVLLEDLGDLTLERKFWENQNYEKSLPYFEMALDELIKIQFHSFSNVDKSCTAFKIEFDTAKLLWEMNYGRTHLLEGICNFSASSEKSQALSKTFTSICERLHAEPKFMTHRDYHSRNLMIKFDSVRVIDFQDARLGTIQYDLVSLLKDSYVQIPEAMSDKLLSSYLRKAKPFLPKTFSHEQFQLIYELQSVQRCFKACGSFASFYMQRKDTRYLKYISGTLKKVLKSLTFFPEYRNMTDALIDSGSLDVKYESLV